MYSVHVYSLRFFVHAKLLHFTAAQPILLDGFQEQFVQTGQKVTMHCRFSGNPVPQVCECVRDL